jgi:hypothetical protein
MGKIKKYAKGGSYYIDVKESSKAPTPVKPAQPAKPNTEGWNIPSLKK